MTDFLAYWRALPARARWGLMAGGLAVLVAVAALGLWSLRTEYKVLFTELAPADAAAMVAELDRIKVPYRLEDGGTTILVASDVVHKTRLQLAGQDMPKHGTVGLELFNNSEIGMTEFAQKVNYQRAQQGELTRTILAVEAIQAARVHLAIPEQGLFRKGASQPTASVALTLKPGKALAPAQVKGIQRLVAAAVPNIRPEDVTLLDQHGVALTAAGAADQAAAGDLLEEKRTAEQYLARKVNQVLEQAFGPGQAFASVDLVLNQDRSKWTTERILPANEAAEVPSGVVVHEKQAGKEGAAPDGAKEGAAHGSFNTEVSYQVGRRVEQVVAAVGTVRRLNVAVVLRMPLDAAQVARVRDIVGVAAGVSAERGDAIAVYSMDQLAAQPASPAPPPVQAVANTPAAPSQPHGAAPSWAWWAAPAVLLAVLLAARRRRRPVAAPVARLSHEERAALLHQVRAWSEARTGDGLEKTP
ncbi:flagellar basal-body MS-ring/collar protein FliF [Massilia endophytica]|uniref:flagellar basal-body MS-ring/collar protein FliF n=1 Tax=Massilia endophytica TaxID=2899220 RepID=UPI001E334F6A|nr:flagellar basal-body MS-ring/collar protein FliF [Massilia endophytica]UGQ47967.1 flagellar M-ring protein FliF [Massilia endophytica]